MRAYTGCGLAAMLVLALGCQPALADTTVYYRAGPWDAFSGPGDGGVPVCGIGTTNPVDGRSFSLRVSIGADSVTFQTKRPSWDIPNGTTLQVVMQVGLDVPWTFQANGNGQVVTWTLDRNSMQGFDSQFRGAASMTLSFPSGNEAPWTIALNGSTAISNAWGRCVSELAQRAPTQPPPPTPTGATQPFGQPPTQPMAPPPTQPVAPPPTQPMAPPPTQP